MSRPDDPDSFLKNDTDSEVIGLWVTAALFCATLLFLAWHLLKFIFL